MRLYTYRWNVPILYQERVGELDVVSTMAVVSLKQSIHMISDPVAEMEVYA